MSETVKHTPVTRDEAISFLESACRNWSHVPALSEDDIGDVATELLRFAIKRSPALEILEALREAEHLADVMEHMTACRSDDEWVWGVQKKIKDAIAKATGGSHDKE